MCIDDCNFGGRYDPSNMEDELRWCMDCNKWMHLACLGDECDLEDGEDNEQDHLLLQGPELWQKLISHPIRRVSRENKPPLSLEKIQNHLIVKKKNGSELMDGNLLKEVQEADLFCGEIPEDALKIVEKALIIMGGFRWYKCAECLSYYI